MPIFSIIIPTFNSEKVIFDALKSCRAQTFTNIEILVMDGSSKDNTIPLVKEFAQRDERIKYVSEKDSGIYDAMNKGIKKANGDWVFFF